MLRTFVLSYTFNYGSTSWKKLYKHRKCRYAIGRQIKRSTFNMDPGWPADRAAAHSSSIKNEKFIKRNAIFLLKIHSIPQPGACELVCVKSNHHGGTCERAKTTIHCMQQCHGPAARLTRWCPGCRPPTLN